jgi:hypothetical protein
MSPPSSSTFVVAPAWPSAKLLSSSLCPSGYPKSLETVSAGFPASWKPLPLGSGLKNPFSVLTIRYLPPARLAESLKNSISSGQQFSSTYSHQKGRKIDSMVHVIRRPVNHVHALPIPCPVYNQKKASNK